MADLFQVKVPTINEHLKTLYAEGEIQPEATIRNFLIVRQEGARQVSRNKMTRQAIQYALGLSNRATGQPFPGHCLVNHFKDQATPGTLTPSPSPACAGEGSRTVLSFLSDEGGKTVRTCHANVTGQAGAATMLLAQA